MARYPLLDSDAAASATAFFAAAALARCLAIRSAEVAAFDFQACCSSFDSAFHCLALSTTSVRPDGAAPFSLERACRNSSSPVRRAGVGRKRSAPFPNAPMAGVIRAGWARGGLVPLGLGVASPVCRALSAAFRLRRDASEASSATRKRIVVGDAGATLLSESI